MVMGSIPYSVSILILSTEKALVLVGVVNSISKFFPYRLIGNLFTPPSAVIVLVKDADPDPSR
jgi:hypothetical protein